MSYEIKSKWLYEVKIKDETLEREELKGIQRHEMIT